MWVITEAYNKYDQEGDYLKTAFHKKPTIASLSKLFKLSISDAKKLWDGKLETSKDYHWLYLSEIDEGEIYKTHP